jgi:SNF2 family DNA or RNA helicase
MKVELDFDAPRGRFIARAPFALQNIIRGIPNRRWVGKSRYWSIPAIRVNVSYIAANPHHFDSTPAASRAISEALDRYAQHRSSPDVQRFPAWYPWKTPPREHQRRALNKVYNQSAIALFMSMRTGKSKTVIDLAAARRMEGKLDRLLIVCPLSIRRNWVREFEAHSPIPADIHLLDTERAFDRWFDTPNDFKVFVVGVESLATGKAPKIAERFLLAGTRCMMVVDESSKIKNPRAARTKSAIKLSKFAETRLILTGTPLANGPVDLFAQFEFLDPDILGVGDYYSFRNRYAIMGGYEGKQIVGYQNLEELTEIVEPFVFQVSHHDAFPDDPDKVYVQREVELAPEQERLYKQMRKHLMVETGDRSLTVKNALEKALRLQQIVGGHVAYANDDGTATATPIQGTNPKLQELLAVIEETPGSVIIWCAYVPEILMVAEKLRAEYGAASTVELHGTVDESTRDHNVNGLFQTGAARFLVANAATGSMGLTMSVAATEVFYSNSFNYTDREQAEARAFAPGKPQGTLIIDLVARDTVDEGILEALANKESLATYLSKNIERLKGLLT